MELSADQKDKSHIREIGALGRWEWRKYEIRKTEYGTTKVTFVMGVHRLDVVGNVLKTA